MAWWVWVLIVIYITGFLWIFFDGAEQGRAALRISFVRAAVWPIYLATGWPSGERARMD